MQEKSFSPFTFLKAAPNTLGPRETRVRQRKHSRLLSSKRKRGVDLEARRVPVMVRGTVPGLPMATPRRTTRTSHRLDVPVGLPGVEIRLPSLPRIAIGWRLLSAFLSFSLIGLLYLLWTAPLFQVNSVSLQGLQRISAKEVMVELDLRGQPVFTLDPREIQEKLIAQFPEFRKVEVSLGFPNKVYIYVDERKPILAWKQGDRTLLVDAEGYAFPLRSEDTLLPKLIIEAQDAPLPTGAEKETDVSRPFLPVELISGIVSIGAMIPEGATLFYERERGLGWRDPRGWTVYVGALKDLSLKMKIYELMVKKLKKEKQKPVLISIEYIHAPYYRLER
ncbi:MAG: FtsQ-type POTRA domain-containing protein [Anaerolineales bacterium]|nr:FtsQ-type POTRA domain-containing protein [Anaerolineales bacterium]MDW8160475.1 FtsQ-type POTRA domain-containing protein [Anaerolineales bacterium]